MFFKKFKGELEGDREERAAAAIRPVEKEVGKHRPYRPNRPLGRGSDEVRGRGLRAHNCEVD